MVSTMSAAFDYLASPHFGKESNWSIDNVLNITFFNFIYITDIIVYAYVKRNEKFIGNDKLLKECIKHRW